MKITVSDGRMNKVHISVDGEYLWTVDEEYWYSSRWKRITEIDDPDTIEEFYTETGSRCAFISGLRLLSYSDNSRKELKRKLISKGHKAEYVEIALDKLAEYGYINDLRYAKYKAMNLIEKKHMSSAGVKAELIKKGVDSETVRIVIEEMEFSPVDDIRKLLDGKYSRYLDTEKGVKKTIAALQRLGYRWSDIKAAMSMVNLESEDTFYD